MGSKPKALRAPLAFRAWSSSCCGGVSKGPEIGRERKAYSNDGVECLDDEVAILAVQLISGNIVGDVLL